MIPPARNEDALDDSSSDVADGEELVLSPRDRVEHNGRPDVRDDEQELQERAQVDLVVLAATSDVTGRIVEHRLEESECADRRDERDQEEHSEDPRIPLVFSHLASSAARYGTRRDVAILNRRSQKPQKRTARSLLRCALGGETGAPLADRYALRAATERRALTEPRACPARARACPRVPD
jgi:hypothetical protein